MLTRPDLGLVVLAAISVVVGVLAGSWLSGVFVGAFLLVLGSIDAKPSWKRILNPPGKPGSGNDQMRFFSWRKR